MTKALLQKALNALTRAVETSITSSMRADEKQCRDVMKALQAAIYAPEVGPFLFASAFELEKLHDQSPTASWCKTKYCDTPLYTEPPDTAALRLELDRVKGENAKMLRNIQMFSDVIDNHCIAMQSALIANHLENPRSGLQWIYNTLRGPGLLPDICEAIELGGAQAWFDAKSAEREKAKAIAAQGEPNAK